MLSVQANEEITRVGAGTPMGELMRRYWHPIAATPELKENPTKSVRLLGENLTLYKDRSGTLGLIDESCPHRRVNLLYGIPEEKGLRCPYHGWLMDETGQCIEMPAEAPDSTFKDRVKVRAYPVQELGGLVFAYLGPEPAPLLPRWEWLVEQHAYRQVNFLVLPANWLQCMENSLDSTHTEWLHGHYANYVYSRNGAPQERLRTPAHHLKIGYDVFEYGIIKRRVQEGETEEDADWVFGHPILFPNILSGPNQFRVPIDDGHTLHVDYVSSRLDPDVPAPAPEEIGVYYAPLRGDDGRIITNYLFGQDYMAWATQGQHSDGIAERHLEKLAESDKGIILYRRLLKEQMKVVADGGEPMNSFRDPATNQCVELPSEAKGVAQGLKSVRLAGANAQRGDLGFAAQNGRGVPARGGWGRREPSPWMRPEGWAGNGLYYYYQRLEKQKSS